MEAAKIYVRFSDDGRHIRKWAFDPFEDGSAFARVSLAKPQIPDGIDKLDFARELWARCMEASDGRAKLSIAADIRAGTLDESAAMVAIVAALSAQMA